MVEALPDSQKTKRKHWMLGLLSFFLVLGVSFGVYYKLVLSLYETTDDAYIGGNLVGLTPQVSGIVTDIRTDETQFVHAGDALVLLDSTDASVVLRQAAAELGEIVRQLRQQYANARESEQLMQQRKIELARAQGDYQRRQPLASSNVVAREEVDHAHEAVQKAQAALDAARYQAEAAQAWVEGTDIRHHPSVLKARTKFTQAWLAVRRNTLVAPVSGYVAKRNVQVGTRVTPGMNLLSIVPLDQLWVNANFKESQLAALRVGQPATVTADVYGSRVKYQGKVVGFSAGTGSAFSLLPAQNATGNWIKVVQRLPVRIGLDAKELAAHPLRIGLSTAVEVETRDRRAPILNTVSQSQSVYTTAAFTVPLQDAEAEADVIITQNVGRNR